MKHINRYNNFIRLNENEDVEIKRDISEHDFNIIKNALIDVEDFGFTIVNIMKYKNTEGISIRLVANNLKITKYIDCEYEFNKDKFYHEKESRYNNGYLQYKSTEYDEKIIKKIKECSQLLLNVLEFNIGEIVFHNDEDDIFLIDISLYKNKNK